MKIEQERVMKWILDFFEAKTTDLYDDPTFFSFYVWEHKWIYRKLVQNPSGLIPLFICQPPMQTNTQRIFDAVIEDTTSHNYRNTAPKEIPHFHVPLF